MGAAPRPADLSRVLPKAAKGWPVQFLKSPVQEICDAYDAQRITAPQGMFFLKLLLEMDRLPPGGGRKPDAIGVEMEEIAAFHHMESVQGAYLSMNDGLRRGIFGEYKDRRRGARRWYYPCVEKLRTAEPYVSRRKPPGAAAKSRPTASPPRCTPSVHVIPAGASQAITPDLRYTNQTPEPLAVEHVEQDGKHELITRPKGEERANRIQLELNGNLQDTDSKRVQTERLQKLFKRNGHRLGADLLARADRELAGISWELYVDFAVKQFDSPRNRKFGPGMVMVFVTQFKQQLAEEAAETAAKPLAPPAREEPDFDADAYEAESEVRTKEADARNRAVCERHRGPRGYDLDAIEGDRDLSARGMVLLQLFRKRDRLAKYSREAPLR